MYLTRRVMVVKVIFLENLILFLFLQENLYFPACINMTLMLVPCFDRKMKQIYFDFPGLT